MEKLTYPWNWFEMLPYSTVWCLSAARQPWKIQPHLSFFSFMWHVQVFCLVWDDTWKKNMMWRDWSRCWKMVSPTRHRGSLWRNPKHGVPGLEPVPGNWWLRQMAVHRRHSTVRALQMDFLQAPGQRLSELRNRLQENGLHSRRPARGPILTGNTVELDLTLSTLAAASLASHSLHRRVQIPCLYLWPTCEGMETGRWTVCWQQHHRIQPICWWVCGGMRRHMSGQTNGPGGHWWRCVNSCAVSGWNPWTSGTTFAGALGQDFVLMHDNARPHTARVIQVYLEQKGIDVMEWPARSPDLSPIDHLWDILQRRVSGCQNPPATVQALTAALREEWNGINQVSVRHLIQSMPRRCQQCIQSRGGHTSFWSVFSPLKLLYGTSETIWMILCALCDHFVLGGKLSLVFRMCNLSGHEVILYCVLFSCICEICTTRNCLFMK